MENNQEEFIWTVEELGRLYFSPLEIAIILELDIHVFLKEFGFSEYEAFSLANQYNQHTQIYKDIQKGRLLGKAKFRHRLFEQAYEGSSPAQKTMLEIIEYAEISEKLAIL